MLLKKITIITLSFGILFMAIAINDQNHQVVQAHSDTWKQAEIAKIYHSYAQEFPEVKEITVKQLRQLRQQHQKIVLVDVRSPEEIAVSYIPGAITAKEFERNLEQYRGSLVIAYCTIGYRSGRYAQKLDKQGIEILNLAGSLLAWTHGGGELTNQAGATNKIHVFGQQWQLTPRNYQPVW